MNREKIDYDNVMGNYFRRKIIESCREKKNASELKKQIKISWGALYHHLKVLEDAGLIIKHQIKNKEGKKKLGRETEIITNLRKFEDIDKQKKEERDNRIKKYKEEMGNI